MAMMTTSVMVNEIANRLGPRADVAGSEGTPPSGRIIRAINDSLLELVLTYRIPQFEAFPPWYVESNVNTSFTGTNTANGDTITTNASVAATLLSTTAGVQCFVVKFADAETYHQITAIDGGGTGLTVSPRIPTAHTAAALTFVQTMFLFPTTNYATGTASDLFAIVNVRDMERGCRVKHQDIRGVDKVAPTTGPVAYYSRWKDYLILSPIVATTDVRFQVRYLKRPAYVAIGTDLAANTLAPLPEEWQESVINLATAKCLACQGEEQRAAWFIAQVDNKAQALRSSYADDADDFSFSVFPSRSAFNRSR